MLIKEYRRQYFLVSSGSNSDFLDVLRYEFGTDRLDSGGVKYISSSSSSFY